MREGLLAAESPLALRSGLVQLLPSPATGEAQKSGRTEVSLCSSDWWEVRSVAVSCDRPGPWAGPGSLPVTPAWGVHPRAPRARDRHCPGKGPAPPRTVPLIAADGYTVRMARPLARSHTRPRAHDGPGPARTAVSGQSTTLRDYGQPRVPTRHQSRCNADSPHAAPAHVMAARTLLLPYTAQPFS